MKRYLALFATLAIVVVSVNAWAYKEGLVKDKLMKIKDAELEKYNKLISDYSALISQKPDIAQDVRYNLAAEYINSISTIRQLFFETALNEIIRSDDFYSEMKQLSHSSSEATIKVDQFLKALYELGTGAKDSEIFFKDTITLIQVAKETQGGINEILAKGYDEYGYHSQPHGK